MQELCCIYQTGLSHFLSAFMVLLCMSMCVWDLWSGTSVWQAWPVWEPQSRDCHETQESFHSTTSPTLPPATFEGRTGVLHIFSSGVPASLHSLLVWLFDGITLNQLLVGDSFNISDETVTTVVIRPKYPSRWCSHSLSRAAEITKKHEQYLTICWWIAQFKTRGCPTYLRGKTAFWVCPRRKSPAGRTLTLHTHRWNPTATTMGRYGMLCTSWWGFRRSIRSQNLYNNNANPLFGHHHGSLSNSTI